MAKSFLPKGNSYTFWVRVVSKVNSDLFRRFKDVRNMVQNKVPIEKSVNRVRKGEDPKLEIGEMILQNAMQF